MPKTEGSKQPVVAKHRHCNMCGAPVKLGASFCSVNCEAESKRLTRRRTWTLLLTLALFPAILVILRFLVP